MDKRLERNRNGGIRKRCGCPAKSWTKCQHPWHFNFKWNDIESFRDWRKAAGLSAVTINHDLKLLRKMFN